MEIRTKLNRDRVYSAEDIFEIMLKIFYKKGRETDSLKEHVWIFGLREDRRILVVELVSIGTDGKTLAGPHEIFRLPIYKGATHLIIVHNHTSGTPKPSEADLDTTNRLIKVGEILNIHVLDHIIITRNSYYSFAEMGLMKELQRREKYSVPFMHKKQVSKQIEQIKRDARKSQQEVRKQGIVEGEAKGAKIRSKEIAKHMLLDGESLEKIKKYTSLTSQWLGRLKNELAKKS